jgi:hypothetical protein
MRIFSQKSKSWRERERQELPTPQLPTPKSLIGVGELGAGSWELEAAR